MSGNILTHGAAVNNSSYESMNLQAAYGGYGGYGKGNLLTGLNTDDIKNIPLLKGSAAALHLEGKI